MTSKIVVNNIEPDAGISTVSILGIATATKFVGDVEGAVTGAVTGNVTGNVTGSSGSCTGNAATATVASGITTTASVNTSGIITATTFEATTFSKTPTNTPAFHAWSSPVISPAIADATMTKVEFLVTETFDTDNAYDNSSSGTTANRFTVPAGKTGFYQVSAGLNFYANNNDIRHCRMAIKQNGSIKMTAYGFISSYHAGTRHVQCNLSGILQLANDGDYLELFGYLDTNGGSQGYFSNDAQGYRGNFFSAFKLII